MEIISHLDIYEVKVGDRRYSRVNGIWKFNSGEMPQEWRNVESIWEFSTLLTIDELELQLNSPNIQNYLTPIMISIGKVLS